MNSITWIEIGFMDEGWEAEGYRDYESSLSMDLALVAGYGVTPGQAMLNLEAKMKEKGIVYG